MLASSLGFQTTYLVLCKILRFVLCLNVKHIFDNIPEKVQVQLKICVFIYIHIYIYIHTHTHTHTQYVFTCVFEHINVGT